MPSLDDHFRALTRVRPPDDWPELGNREPTQFREPPLRRRLSVAGIALAVAVAGLAFAVRAFTGGTPPRPGASPDEARIAFVTGHGASTEIHLVDEDGSGDERLVIGRTPAWSPDGTRIAFRTGDPEKPESEKTISVIDADGTDGHVLATLEGELQNPGAPTWSPDGSMLAFAINGIYVVNADGTDLRLVTRYDGERTCADLEPSWSPDGSSIAFAVRCEAGNEGIWLVDPDGTDRRQLLAPSKELVSLSFPAWSPDGSRIAFAGVSGGPPEFEYDIYVMNADGGGITKLTEGLGFPTMPSWSPDGSKIAFLDWSTERVLAINADGTDPQTIAEGATGCCPAWQPVRAAVATPTPAETTPVSPVTPHITATIPVGSFPRDIAVGAGAVWVTVNDFPEGEQETHSLLRIDPASNEIAATIPVRSAGHLAVGSDAVWTTEFREERDVLVRIDPRSNEVVATIPVGRLAFDVAVDESGVWVTRDIDSRSGEVIRIDPATNEIVARIPVEGRIRDVVLGEGGVWVVDSTSTIREEPSLIHIDPGTNQVAGRIPGLAGLDVVTGDGLAWVQGWLSTVEPEVGTGSGDRPVVLRIDPRKDEIVGEPIPLAWFYPFAFGEGGVWFVDQRAGPAVSRLNTETIEVDHSVGVASVAQDSTVHAVLDAETGTIWVANYEDTITRIDLR